MANRRRMNGKKTFYKQGGDAISSDTLSDRALQVDTLYNYLSYESPKDVDGVKRAYVTVDDDKIDAKPIPANQASIAQMYGKKPTIVADETAPTALITRYSPKDKLFPQLEESGTELIRSMLRRIVDEA